MMFPQRSDYFYRLDENNQAVPVKDINELGIKANHVGDTTKYGVRVSTVFLRINHNFLREGPPLLFETMVFGGPYDQLQWRCSTWAQAQDQHQRVCRKVHTWRAVTTAWLLRWLDDAQEWFYWKRWKRKSR